MVLVRINGEDTSINAKAMPLVTDLVELIKQSIDPDHMITAILLDGREFDDEDWTASTSQLQETSVIEVETGTPESFVASRMAQCANIVGGCYLLFREARKHFQSGSMVDGNKALVEAVETLQAFLQWYMSVTNLLPEESRKDYDITKNVEEISKVAQKITQQQMYQSWWALGETIKGELEPLLDSLEDVCRGFANRT